jgi:hypothetical protein
MGLPKGGVKLGGNYREIISLRATLEAKKYSVDTFIVRPDCSVFKESIFLGPEIDLKALASAADGEISSLEMECYDAVILALTGKLLSAIAEAMIERIVLAKWKRLIFISSGRIAAENSSRLFSAYGISPTFLQRKGVARVTRTGVGIILDKLRTPR